MLGAREHMQFLVHLAAERTLGEHALHREFDGALGVLHEQLAECDGLDTADRAGVVVIDLVIELVARDFDLLGVQHHDVIASVDMRAVDGLVLALEAHGDLGAETAQDLVGGIDDIPVAAHGLVLRKYSTHLQRLQTGRAPRSRPEDSGVESMLAGPWKKGRKCTQAPMALQNNAKSRPIIPPHGDGPESGHLYLRGRPRVASPARTPGGGPAHACPRSGPAPRRPEA